MGRKNRDDFPMTPAQQQFTYELASEIGITGLGERPLAAPQQNQKQQPLKK